MIKPLTSLRFFFALCVFLSHLSFLKADKTFAYVFNNIFSEGFLGVSFFFILSGFILALNYREKFKNTSITIRKFYTARFARIYPLHFVTMLVAIPLMFGGIKTFICNVFLLQSYIPYEKYFFSYNAPSWSISNEVFFYALFPVLIGISYKFKTIFKIILCGAFVSIIILMNIRLSADDSHYWLYISPFTRIFDFILGILLFDVCLYLKKVKLDFNQNLYALLEVLAFAALILFFVFKDYFAINYRYSIYYWLPMCLIIMVSANSFFSERKTTLISKILSWKYFVYLGEISFGFYLIHYLVINYATKCNGFMGFHIQGLPFALLIFFITLITSIFAFEKIEKPFNKKIKNGSYD